MDPSKSANAPPPDWGNKSTMGQSAPPPYSNSDPGYPPHPQVYGGAPQYGGAAYVQQYPQQATVTAQPTVQVTQGPLAPPVNDYLCYSIFTMLCCCMPFGVAALVYSILAREANYMGDRLGAERKSRTARTLNHVALGLGIGILILTIVFVVVEASLVS